jgi:hypothetical protein
MKILSLVVLLLAGPSYAAISPISGGGGSSSSSSAVFSGWERVNSGATACTNAAEVSVSCTAGKKVMGCGCLISTTDGTILLTRCYPSSDSACSMRSSNSGAGPTCTVYAMCATVN